jgi:hypothetical protein
VISANVKQWIEIVGGVALIVSLGLLVIEIRQNTDAVSAQAVSDLNHQANESNLSLASNPELAELFLRLQANPWESLSAVDRVRGEFFARGFFNRVYTAYNCYQRGIFSAAEYGGWRDEACNALEREGPARIWAERRPTQNPEFVHDVDSHCEQSSR